MYHVKLNEITTIKQGDTKRVFTAQIIDSANIPVVLTGASVTLFIAKRDAVVLQKTATITSGIQGEVSFSFSDDDITGSGYFDAEFQVTFSDLTRITAPTNDYLKIKINQKLPDRGNETITPSLYTQVIEAQSGQDAKIETQGNEIDVLSDKVFLKGLKTIQQDPAFDNGAVIKQAILDGKRGVIPNGEYNIGTLVKISLDIDSVESDIPIFLEGESPDGVKFTSSLTTIMDFTRSKNVYVKNMTSDKNILLVQYGLDFIPFSRKRSVKAENIFNTKATGEPINWGMLINTPAPSNYSDSTGGGKYARYPLEIVDHSGYNSIMINKFAQDDAGVLQQPPDASAIGIIDQVANATGVILVEGGKRSFLQFKNKDAASVSDIRQYLAYEVDQAGHVGIGCSTQSGDVIAPGTAAMKIRMPYPSIKLYDQNRNNHLATLSLADDFLNLTTTNDADGKQYGFKINYKTGETKLSGTYASDNLTLTNSNTNHAPSVSNVSRITFDNLSGSWVEIFSGSKNGQVIQCITKNTNTTIRHREYANAECIYTKGGIDFVMQVGQVYSFIKFEDSWYQM